MGCVQRTSGFLERFINCDNFQELFYFLQKLLIAPKAVGKKKKKKKSSAFYSCRIGLVIGET